MSNSSKQNDLLLVSGSSFTSQNLVEQLKSFLPKDITIHSYYTDEDCPPLESSFFTIFSSQETYDEFIDRGLSSHLNEYIIGTRTVLNDKLDIILTLPRDRAILLATDSKGSAMETMEHLKNIGFDFLHLVPFYPGGPQIAEDISIAVTPGDPDVVPSGIPEVYNIGTRLFDFATVAKIMARYHLLEDQIQPYADRYLDALLDFAKRISNVANDATKVMKTVRTELIRNGYYAKYHFSDIIGENLYLQRARNIARKLGKTELSVLIEGDNGTGKELFASAIHNASSRAKGPFVAINFSALPDQLIESELFGYEEGAFTGARKGGKVGLFQQAAGGTIFLDEIGDISPQMQSKLLRVLQEREIMKVGGSRIIPVDVRIIAATNRDLGKMIENGTFRKDLYYRLREGHVQLPDLAHRKEDIPLLISHWQNTNILAPKEISPAVMAAFQAYSWPGNIRELLNVMKYAIAVTESDMITTEDLPHDIVKAGTSFQNQSPAGIPSIDDLSLQVLAAICQINQKDHLAGRCSIVSFLEVNGFQVTEYKVRKTLKRLAAQGFISSRDTGYGVFLTDAGIRILAEHQKL